MSVLVLNSGSSSIKFAIYDDSEDAQKPPQNAGNVELLCRGEIEGISDKPTSTIKHFTAFAADGKALVDTVPADPLSQEKAMALLMDWLEQQTFIGDIEAVGHRVVHGGKDFFRPLRVDRTVLKSLCTLIPLAPLHQPHNLSPIETLLQQRPALPQIACFDTAFHSNQPAIAQQFALPQELTRAGILRYGFHGLSYEYIAKALATCPGGKTIANKTIVAHLGNGASMCAMLNGQSVATTMGFTALEGLPMGTRCGALDPGVVLYLLQEQQMTPAQITDLLYHKSGLLGVSGISNDMRTLLASDSAAARHAIDVFTYRIGRELGSLTAALGGLDTLVFTGGIGEHCVEIRQQVAASAAWLGVKLDTAANRINVRRGEKQKISSPDSAVTVWVIPTDEEQMIAHRVYETLNNGIKT